MGSLGSLVGNIAQMGSVKDAEKAQLRALDQARQVSERNLKESKALLKPFVDSGNLAHQAILFERGLGSAPTISNAGYEVGGTTYGTQEEADNALKAATGRFNKNSNLRRPSVGADWGKEGYGSGVPVFATTAGGDKVLGAAGQYTGYDTRFSPAAGIAAAGFDPRGASVQEVDPVKYGGFEFSPDHKFLMEQGLNAVSSQASATGSRNSGATLQALQERGTNLANTFREQYLGALGVLSSQGQGAIGQQIQAGNLNAGNVGNILAQQGNVSAASEIAQGRLMGQAIADGFNFVGQVGGMAGGGFGGMMGGGGGMNSMMSGINAFSQFGSGSAAPIFAPQPQARPTLSF